MSAVFTTIATIIVHTPVWVWFLYALLLFLSLQRTRDRLVPLWRELILPLVVTSLALASFIGAGPGGLPAMLSGLMIGGAAGWRFEREDATRRQPDGSIWLRGEWASFGQILVVLVFRYVTSAVSAMAPTLNADFKWHTGTLLIGTALSALFLGRAARRLRVYFSAKTATA